MNLSELKKAESLVARMAERVAASHRHGVGWELAVKFRTTGENCVFRTLADVQNKVSGRDAIQKKIDALLAIEVCVGHNEGTFSAQDAHRKVGTGDPSFATRTEYETVGGKKRATGPALENTPGTMRYCRDQLVEYRRQLAELQAELQATRN